MAVNYVVRASVVDIRSDVPDCKMSYVVDTNAWYWQTYSRASLFSDPPHEHQTRYYPNYIEKVLDSGGTLYSSVHNLIELSSQIERVEAEIYRQKCGIPKLSVKEFRHQNDAVRSIYRSEIDSVWSQVSSMSEQIEQAMNAELVGCVAGMFQSDRLDAYDILILLSAKSINTMNIISDDGDFSTVDGVTLYTANSRVIDAARNSGRLLNRRR